MSRFSRPIVFHCSRTLPDGSSTNRTFHSCEEEVSNILTHQAKHCYATSIDLAVDPAGFHNLKKGFLWQPKWVRIYNPFYSSLIDSARPGSNIGVGYMPQGGVSDGNNWGFFVRLSQLYS